MRQLAAVQWDEGIENAWSSIATFVPRLLGFLLILALGYLVAKTIATAIDNVLEKIGFDRAVERGGIRQALANSKYDASDLVARLVFFTLFLFVLQLAFGVFGTNPISALIAGVIAFLPKLFVAIVIVVVASALAAGVKDVVGNALGGLSYGKTLANGASISILVLGVFMALNQIEIAPAIVNGLFYGLLAIVVGSAIIAIGGGGIQPMRARWEQALNKVDEEAPKIKEHARSASTVRGHARVDLRNSSTGLPMQEDVTVSAPTSAPETTEIPMQDRIRQELRDRNW